MNGLNRTKFLSDYIMSLLERTRQEKHSLKIGFDWAIFNLATALDWSPVRLPFLRKPDASAKSKSEPEYGVDMSFVTATKDTLIIFVLKDEPLTYSNWTSHGFDSDLRRAATPDLSQPGLSQVKSVKVILAYNKDEEQSGVQSFDLLISSLGTKVGDRVSLSFERWNLTILVEQVEAHLMTPDLLPQHLAGILHYICAQIKDFEYESSEWSNQLVPNWRNFLKMALSGIVDERKIRLIPVAVLILHHFKKSEGSSEAGWIDLIEWASLGLWQKFQELENAQLRNLIGEIWIKLYLETLEGYLIRNEKVLAAQHGLHHTAVQVPGLTPIADANLAFWQLGRLGIFTMGLLELLDAKDQEAEKHIKDLAARSADWLAVCLRNNPSANRPLIDLHHIELFLFWYIFWAAGRIDDIGLWLSDLEGKLLVRRAGRAHVPFVEARNRMDLVVEHVAKGQKPPEFSDTSSYLLLLIVELCFSLEAEIRNELLRRYLRLIKGIGDDGNRINAMKEGIDLIGWAPPGNWEERILKESVHDGVAITGISPDALPRSGGDYAVLIENAVKESREKFPFRFSGKVPWAVLVLACIKHRSPLPAEFWRGALFPVSSAVESPAGGP